MGLAATFALVLAFGPGLRLGAGPDAPGLGVVPVLADCAAPLPIDEAVLLGEVVFVGTVLRVDNGSRWATVRVEERWRGARDLAETVQVRGGPEPGTATSIDRLFAPGRYLFVVTRGQDYLGDNACSATRPWTEDLAAVRPPDVTPSANVAGNVEVLELDLGPLVPVVALVVALVIAVLAYVLTLRARRRPPDWLR